MAQRYLIDASVIVRMARGRVAAAVAARAQDGVISRTTITDLEVCATARNASEWEATHDRLELFDPVETTSRHVARALQVQRMLAGRSRRGRPIPDLLVAAAAEDQQMTVLHYDQDFDRIAAVTGQRCEWVVPAGSID